MLNKITKKVLQGENINKDEALKLCNIDLDELTLAANKIREYFCGNKFDMCTIINGKSGRCSEDCKYCAQSSKYVADVNSYPLLETEDLMKDAIYNHEKGVLRYSVVTSGKYLSDKEIDLICESYSNIKETCNIKLCASHGLLNYEQFCKLKKAGVTRYHNNLETSSRFFSYICTTHTFEDKIKTIKAAQRAGLTVCSGGIMGLGESMEDRIDMALTLRELGISSVPVNILNPIKGTPFENNPILTLEEVRRIVAIYRFILPKSAIRLAGGRGLLKDKGYSVFQSGANAAITGDMLTTGGISIDEDKIMIKDLGYEVKPHV